jgi:threonine-phosphate decarboxylase
MKHGGRVYEYAEQMNVSVESIHDFSANMNPFGPPASVLSAVRTMPVFVISSYPDARHSSIKSILANELDIDANALFCGNGATEVMELIVRNIQPKRVVVLEPAFSEYAAIAFRNRIQVVRIPLLLDREFALPISALDTCLQRNDLVFLNYPHNPSGRVWPRSEWEDAVRSWSRRGVTVVCDESFIDFLSDINDLTAVPLVREEEHVFVVRSATKMYAIPGLRFGFGVGNAKIVADIEKERDPWSVNQIAQIAAMKAYRDTGFLEKTRRWLLAEQAYIKDTWGKSPWVRFFVPQANFFLVQFNDAKVAQELQSTLRKNWLFLRDCTDFTCLGPNYLRIGIRSHTENELLWSAVTRFFNC